MTYIIPALPDTLLLIYDSEDSMFSLTPVVGWASPTGGQAFPVPAVGGRKVDQFAGIEHGTNGMVSYPHKGMVFDDRESFGAYMMQADLTDASPPQEVTKTVPRTPEKVVPQPRDRTAIPVATTKTAAVITGRQPIKFGNQSYKTKSFWSWPEANAVFSIEPEDVLPNDARVTKVKRLEFDELKRAGAVKINPHHGDIQEPTGTIGGAEIVGNDEPEEDWSNLV